MAATPIGVDTITAISRRILREEATDVYYKGSPVTWRMFTQKKVVRRGGFQIESRFIYKPWSTGGSFYGPEVLSVDPSDTEIDGVWLWKENYTNVTLSARDMARADHPDAVANLVVEQCENAKMDLRDKIATQMWSYGSNFRDIDGLLEVVDDGTLSTTYAGLTRSSYPFTKAQIDSSTTTLSLSSLNSLWDLCTIGARAPKMVASTRSNLTRYENLLQPQVQYTQPTAVVDQTFANGGFSGGLFRGQPWLVDEHIPTSGTGSGSGNLLFMLNDDYMELCINSNGDWVVGDFQQPVNQMVMTSLVYVMCNLICTNPQLNGKMTALTG
jgi:hypothetical protein